MKTTKEKLLMAQEIDTASTLWQNIVAIMLHHYQEENLSRLSDECGFSQSTATRIKQGKVSPSIDKLDLIAHRFGLSAWQLIVPGFDPKNPPTLQPMSKSERELYEKIRNVAKEIIASEPEARKYL